MKVGLTRRNLEDNDMSMAHISSTIAAIPLLGGAFLCIHPRLQWLALALAFSGLLIFVMLLKMDLFH